MPNAVARNGTINRARSFLFCKMDMNQLHDRSRLFEGALTAIVGVDHVELNAPSLRHLACASACLLSIEHASSVRSLFVTGAPHSGTALLRVQYEALLRSAWVLYAATDLQAGKLSESLDGDAEHAANKLPGPGDMLVALVHSAPTGLTQPLQEFKLVSMKALNSFVHAGIHPVRRMADGFPQALADQIVRNSNGLMHMSFRLLASLSGSQEQMDRATRLYVEFQDCLPMATSSKATTV